jgi:eukaryotic-like serine/threonine-protein kinase
MTLLGRGPVAEVHAFQGTAVKVFPKKFDRRTLTHFERENAKLGKLSAPILLVDDIGQVEGRQALRMELCVESLASRVQRDGALSTHEVVALGAALSRALVAAHGAGVLHGGVSPENVLFRVSGEPVLADFGVALRQAFRRDPLHAIECVSPETLRTGVVDKSTDIYGLGAVLHFALTGESPHPSRIGEPTGERVLRVLNDPVPAISRPDVPTGLSTVIGRLLAPYPVNRQDANWAAARLAEMLPAGAVVRDAPTAPAKSSRLWWYLASGAAALALALGFVFWPRADPAPPPAAAPPVLTVTLADPADRGDHVVLTWTTDDESLHFGVVVSGDGEPSRTLLAERNRTMKVPVDPVRKYCFQIRGSNGDRFVESQAKPIRGAIC